MLSSARPSLPAEPGLAGRCPGAPRPWSWQIRVSGLGLGDRGLQGSIVPRSPAPHGPFCAAGPAGWSTAKRRDHLLGAERKMARPELGTTGSSAASAERVLSSTGTPRGCLEATGLGLGAFQGRRPEVTVGFTFLKFISFYFCVLSIAITPRPDFS